MNHTTQAIALLVLLSHATVGSSDFVLAGPGDDHRAPATSHPNDPSLVLIDGSTPEGDAGIPAAGEDGSISHNDAGTPPADSAAPQADSAAPKPTAPRPPQLPAAAPSRAKSSTWSTPSAPRAL